MIKSIIKTVKSFFEKTTISSQQSYYFFENQKRYFQLLDEILNDYK